MKIAIFALCLAGALATTRAIRVEQTTKAVDAPAKTPAPVRPTTTRASGRSLYASGILFHNIPRVIRGCQTYEPQTDSVGHAVFINGEAVYNEYVPDLQGNGVSHIQDFTTVSAGIISVFGRYFYVTGIIAPRSNYRTVDLQPYGQDVLSVIQLAN